MTILVLVISCEVNQLPCLDVEQLFFLQTSQSAKLCRSTTYQKLVVNQILCISLRSWSLFNSFIKSLTNPLIHFLVQRFIRSTIHPSVHPSIHPFPMEIFHCMLQAIILSGREGTNRIWFKKTLPKAEWVEWILHKSWSNFLFRISTKHQL